jgi:hypothetical protein
MPSHERTLIKGSNDQVERPRANAGRAADGLKLSDIRIVRLALYPPTVRSNPKLDSMLVTLALAPNLQSPVQPQPSAKSVT